MRALPAAAVRLVCALHGVRSPTTTTTPRATTARTSHITGTSHGSEALWRLSTRTAASVLTTLPALCPSSRMFGVCCPSQRRLCHRSQLIKTLIWPPREPKAHLATFHKIVWTDRVCYSRRPATGKGPPRSFPQLWKNLWKSKSFRLFRTARWPAVRLV